MICLMTVTWNSKGEAQQDKARAQRQVARKEAEADVARTNAATHEADQRRHQR